MVISATKEKDHTYLIQSSLDKAEKDNIKNVKFVGVFIVSKVINLKSNINYNFGFSEFKLTKTTIPSNFIFLGKKINKFTITGGKFKMYTKQTIYIPTGRYTNYSAFHLNNCSDFIISNSYFERMYVGLDIYNSKNYSIKNNKFINCNAVIANVAEDKEFVKNFKIIENNIISCGDDGIFVGSIGGNVFDGEILNNLITKTNRKKSSELDGKQIAAVGIRLGKYHFDSNQKFFIYNIIIKNNKLLDMVNHAIYIHNCQNIVIDNNAIDGYAKNITTASPAIQIGEVNLDCKNITVTNNSIIHPYNDMPFIKIVDSDDVTIENNTFADENSKILNKVIKMGYIKDIKIKNNIGL